MASTARHAKTPYTGTTYRALTRPDLFKMWRLRIFKRFKSARVTNNAILWNAHIIVIIALLGIVFPAFGASVVLILCIQQYRGRWHNKYWIVWASKNLEQSTAPRHQTSNLYLLTHCRAIAYARFLRWTCGHNGHICRQRNTLTIAKIRLNFVIHPWRKCN